MSKPKTTSQILSETRNRISRMRKRGSKEKIMKEAVGRMIKGR
jgi:hypothetical protein